MPPSHSNYCTRAYCRTLSESSNRPIKGEEIVIGEVPTPPQKLST